MTLQTSCSISCILAYAIRRFRRRQEQKQKLREVSGFEKSFLKKGKNKGKPLCEFDEGDREYYLSIIISTQSVSSIYLTLFFHR